MADTDASHRVSILDVTNVEEDWTGCKECIFRASTEDAEQTGGVDGVFNWLKRSYIEEDIKEIDKFGLLLCIRGSDDKIVATIGLSATDPEIRPKLRQRILETIELAVPVVQASQSSQSPVTSEPATAVSFSELPAAEFEQASAELMKRSGASIVVHGPYRDPHCTTEGHASSLLSRAIAIIDHIGMTSIIVADITDQSQDEALSEGIYRSSGYFPDKIIDTSKDDGPRLKSICLTKEPQAE